MKLKLEISQYIKSCYDCCHQLNDEDTQIQLFVILPQLPECSRRFSVSGILRLQACQTEPFSWPRRQRYSFIKCVRASGRDDSIRATIQDPCHQPAAPLWDYRSHTTNAQRVTPSHNDAQVSGPALVSYCFHLAAPLLEPLSSYRPHSANKDYYFQRNHLGKEIWGLWFSPGRPCLDLAVKSHDQVCISILSLSLSWLHCTAIHILIIALFSCLTSYQVPPASSPPSLTELTFFKAPLKSPVAPHFLRPLCAFWRSEPYISSALVLPAPCLVKES